uniref:Uncharacterized protein n=1 Tax=Rhizobium loti TaxID=381 RepID=M5B2H3_RHILI|nr:conserved hypothetical protein [Mesorhizobium loti NZP2037]
MRLRSIARLSGRCCRCCTTPTASKRTASSHTTLRQDCINFLDARYGATRALLVDEYQNFTPAVLRELLHLQEYCGFALLLAGNTHRLAGTRRDTHAMDQLESRIGMRFEIGQPTREDCVRIGVEQNVDGADAYEAIVIYGENTSLRALCHLLQNCAALTSGIGGIRLPRNETTLSCDVVRQRCVKLLHERRHDRLDSGQRQIISERHNRARICCSGCSQGMPEPAARAGTVRTSTSAADQRKLLAHELALSNY